MLHTSEPGQYFTLRIRDGGAIFLFANDYKNKNKKVPQEQTSDKFWLSSESSTQI